MAEWKALTRAEKVSMLAVLRQPNQAISTPIEIEVKKFEDAINRGISIREVCLISFSRAQNDNFLVVDGRMESPDS